MCMSLRGVRATGSRTITSALRGQLRTDVRSREEFLAWSVVPADRASAAAYDSAVSDGCETFGARGTWRTPPAGRSTTYVVSQDTRSRATTLPTRGTESARPRRFHLERLTEAGLLDVRFARLTAGPARRGAPAKLYTRATRRSRSAAAAHYDLAGRCWPR